MPVNPESAHCGTIAIVGRPNVGKSTLLNHLMSQKVSITSRRPQTTRHQLQGILTKDNTQFIFVDTPGIHHGRGKALNRYMNKAALNALDGVDVILFMVEALKWTDDDERVLRILQNTNVPVILGINKVDMIKDKPRLMPFLESCQQKYPFKEIFPLSARRLTHNDQLLSILDKYCPKGPWLYEADAVTDRGTGFRVCELIREKVMRTVGEELPYETTVSLDVLEQEEKLCSIQAIVWVEREGQKPILIGEKGRRMKIIGEQARIDLENLFNKKVFLKIWVKVKSGWSDDESALSVLGYHDD